MKRFQNVESKVAQRPGTATRPGLPRPPLNPVYADEEEDKTQRPSARARPPPS